MDEETRKKREAQIKQLEDMQAGVLNLIKDKTENIGIRGRIRFWFLKSLIKKVLKRK